MEKVTEKFMEKVRSTLVDLVGDHKRWQLEDDKKWHVIEDGIKEMSATIKQMVDNQVMTNAPPLQQEKYFKTSCEAALIKATNKKTLLELQQKNSFRASQSRE
eukprot:12052759-Ditylum_brightwellii.AAC.1